MGSLIGVAALVIALLGAIWMDRPLELFNSPPQVSRPDHSKEFDALHSEMEGLGTSAPWAGAFSSGDGLSGTTIYIHPSGRYCLHEWGDIGPGLSSCGRLRDQGDRLASQSKAAWEGSEKDGPAYLKVRWGRRNYLVPVRRVFDFVNSVNSQGEPRSERLYVHGAYLREEEQSLPVPGLPELPEPHRRLLRGQRVSAKVTGAGLRRGRLFWAAAKLFFKFEMPCRVHIALDRGSDAGLFVGMKLEAGEDDEPLSATVTSLGADSAEARVDMFECRGRNPRIGETFSTR